MKKCKASNAILLSYRYCKQEVAGRTEAKPMSWLCNYFPIMSLTWKTVPVTSYKDSLKDVTAEYNGAT